MTFWTCGLICMKPTTVCICFDCLTSNHTSKDNHYDEKCQLQKDCYACNTESGCNNKLPVITLIPYLTFAITLIKTTKYPWILNYFLKDWRGLLLHVNGLSFYSTAWNHMHISCGFHEVDARVVHVVCPCVHLGRNAQSTRQNRDKTEGITRSSKRRLRAFNCLC